MEYFFCTLLYDTLNKNKEVNSMEGNTIDWSLIISIFSICIAGISLGWSIHRDIYLAPRLKTELSFTKTITELKTGSIQKFEVLHLHVTNMGNRPTTIFYCLLRVNKKIRKQYPVITVEPFDFKKQFPIKLESGCETSIHFAPDLFSNNKNISTIGLKTKYNKVVWIPKKEVVKYQRQYKNFISKNIDVN